MAPAGLKEVRGFRTGARIPPQDADAERALLGSLMLRPQGMHQIVDLITPESFYMDRHANIYRAMQDLFSRGEPIDLVSVTSLLRERGSIERVGGSSYLAELTSMVPSAANLEHYAAIVHKKFALRRLIRTSEELAELGFGEYEELDSILDSAGKKVYELGNFAKRTFTHIKDALASAWERFERLQKSDNTLRGVPSGFVTLDNARHAALRHQVPVGIFSLEMSTGQLVERMLAAEGRVDSWKLRTGKLHDDADFSRLRDTLDVFSRAPIFIDDEPSNNIMRMRAVSRRMKAEQGLGLIIVDYLQLMVPRTSSDSVVQQVTEISRSLKSLARELDVPVIALSQLNRAGDSRGGEPRLSDLRDSGSIEQDADVVLLIHREYREDGPGRDNVAKILIAKHRNGPTGAIDLYFDQNLVSFSAIEKGDFGDF